MEKDCQKARARFIGKTVKLREDLSFAHPVQILKAVQILCSDAYVSMLWNLSSDVSEQFFKAWNTTAKLVYGVPRSTFTYLVEGHFAAGHTSLRNQMLSRYSESAQLSHQGSQNSCLNHICWPQISYMFKLKIPKDNDRAKSATALLIS